MSQTKTNQLSSKQRSILKMIKHDPLGFRLARRETQAEFWPLLGVTQSAGSRYESGRQVPKPVAMLAAIRELGIVDDVVLSALASKA